MELMSDTSAIEAAGGVSSVRLRIPAKPEYVALGRLALTGLAQARALPPDAIADLKLALTEAASNSVRHAYGEENAGVVEISYLLLPDRLVIEVIDSQEHLDAVLPEVDRMMGGGLITMEKVRVLRYEV